jgi:chemotaxis protein methyltransferase CheR
VSFESRDLLRQPAPSGEFDLAACRNVVIYFTEEARDALHAKLAGALRPGGFLFVGNAERVANPDRLGLDRVSPQIYRRKVQ